MGELFAEAEVVVHLLGQADPNLVKRPQRQVVQEPKDDGPPHDVHHGARDHGLGLFEAAHGDQHVERRDPHGGKARAVRGGCPRAHAGRLKPDGRREEALATHDPKIRVSSVARNSSLSHGVARWFPTPERKPTVTER